MSLMSPLETGDVSMVASSIDLVPQGNGEVQRPLMSITPVKVGKSSGPEFFLPHFIWPRFFQRTSTPPLKKSAIPMAGPASIQLAQCSNSSWSVRAGGSWNSGRRKGRRPAPAVGEVENHANRCWNTADFHG